MHVRIEVRGHLRDGRRIELGMRIPLHISGVALTFRERGRIALSLRISSRRIRKLRIIIIGYALNVILLFLLEILVRFLLGTLASLLLLFLTLISTFFHLRIALFFFFLAAQTLDQPQYLHHLVLDFSLAVLVSVGELTDRRLDVNDFLLDEAGFIKDEVVECETVQLVHLQGFYHSSYCLFYVIDLVGEVEDPSSS